MSDAMPINRSSNLLSLMVNALVRRWLGKAIVIALSCVCLSSVYADVSQRQDVQDWLQAQNDLGYSKAQVKALLSQVNIQPKVIPAYGDSAERKYVWSDYRQRLLTDGRIKTGVCFIHDNQRLLAAIAHQYGVDSAILAAIMGIETNYGSYLGKYPVLETLVTLAFEHPKRTKRFQRELQLFLKVSHQNDLQPLQVMGSPAGAFGYAQFMPFSHFHYAVDGDGDQRIHLTTNLADNLASIAHYLVEHRWQTGAPLMVQVSANGLLDKVNDRAKSGGTSLPDWQSDGLAIPNTWQTWQQQVNSPEDKFRIYSFSTHTEPEYVLAGANFYAITRYNHSLWYARAVIELANELVKQQNRCEQ